MNKAYKMIALLLSTMLLFTACDKDINSDNLAFDVIDSYYAYNELLRPLCFDVGDDGTVYAFCSSEPYEESYNGMAYTVFDTFLYSCTLDGKLTKLFKIDLAINSVKYYDGMLYCLAFENGNGKLISLGINSGEIKEVSSLYEFDRFISLEISDNIAYIVGISKNRAGLNGEYSDLFGNYRYNGEKLISVKLENGEITESKVEYPVTCSAYGSDFWVYAADKDGYFFSDFDGENKKYNDLGDVTGFEMLDRERFIFSSNSSIGKLSVGSVNYDDGTAEITENTYCVSDSIKYKGGCTFAICSDGMNEAEKIVRFKNSDYIKPLGKIKFISTKYNIESPFGCGYTLERRELDDESFSLTVLSQDKAYDICLINSKESVSGNIRDKGSFYPLNSVKGVNEYLDKCFPYVKNSAITENGEVWAIPVFVTIPIIMYNEKSALQTGIQFNEDISLEQLIDNAYKAHDSSYKNGYSLQCYQLTQNVFLQYLSNHDSFNTDLFRNTVQLMAKRANITTTSSVFPAYTAEIDNLFLGDDKGFLFSYLYTLYEQKQYMSFCENMNAISTPVISGNKNVATCVYVAVNPMSDNMSAALSYISSLCEYLQNTNEGFTLKDKQNYGDGKLSSDIYSIYDNAEICFNIPSEIFFDDYQSYCLDKISLDEFISEADRKLSAYLRE